MNAKRELDKDMGEETSLTSSILVRLSRSRMYLCCESKPVSRYKTSTPRKKARSPRALTAKSIWRSWSNTSMAAEFDAVMMISSTYKRINMVTVAHLRGNKQESALDVVKPICSLLLSHENHARGPVSNHKELCSTYICDVVRRVDISHAVSYDLQIKSHNHSILCHDLKEPDKRSWWRLRQFGCGKMLLDVVMSVSIIK
jgi:hypothetical protein